MKSYKPIMMWIAVVSLMTAITACSSKDEKEGTNSPSTPPSSSQPTASAEKRETIEIFSYTPNVSAALPALNDDFVRQAIEKKLNIDLKLTYNMVEGEDRYNKLNVRLASNDSPDLILAGGLKALEYKNNNMLIDLNSYVSAEKLPNYFKWFTPEVVFKRFSMDKSKPEIQRIPLPVLVKTPVSWYVRQDWLDKLNLKVPTNLAEFEKVAHAFTYDDPDGNGKKDTYGFSVSAGGNGISFDWPQFMANGIEGVLYVKDNKLVHFQMDYRDEAVLRDINRMVKDGSVDPDWFLQKGTAHIDKAIQGRVGIIRDYTGKFGLTSVPSSPAAQSKTINSNAKWTAFNAIDGVPGYQENLPSMSVVTTKIAAKNPVKVEKALQVIDFLLSEEGYLLSRYGKEGVHYTRSGKKITLIPDAIKKDIEDKNNWLGIYQVFSPEQPSTLGLEVIDPRLSDEERAMLKKIDSYPISAPIGTNVSPPAGVDLVAQQKLEAETMAKIALGELPSTEWKKVLDKILNEMGGQKLLDTYTEQIREAGAIK
ncbi:MAG: transporter substrate-binding protein [Paenibacillus sp.]|nr:transporter substrate-binding protein [Paenibacillus sp.]